MIRSVIRHLAIFVLSILCGIFMALLIASYAGGKEQPRQPRAPIVLLPPRTIQV